MSEPLYCAVCGIRLAISDADHAVKTDAGPVHRECFDGPITPADQRQYDAVDLLDETPDDDA